MDFSQCVADADVDADVAADVADDVANDSAEGGDTTPGSSSATRTLGSSRGPLPL